jgi:hypothetical protein
MKKIFYLLIFTPLLFFTGCYPDDCDHHHDFNDHDNNIYDTSNKVLVLKLDYITRELEGGIEYIYNQPTDSFHVDLETEVFDNYNTVRLKYRELDRTLFYGTSLQYGIGEMIIPEAFESSEFFDTVSTNDFVYPINGFNHIPIDQITQSLYYNLWGKIQNLKKVRDYIKANPNQVVTLYIYDPNLGNSDLNNSCWLVILKN